MLEGSERSDKSPMLRHFRVSITVARNLGGNDRALPSGKRILIVQGAHHSCEMRLLDEALPKKATRYKGGFESRC